MTIMEKVRERARAAGAAIVLPENSDPFFGMKKYAPKVMRFFRRMQ